MELDEEDRALPQVVREQRRELKSREPPSPESAVLVTLVILTLEAIEIYIIMRYGDGKPACLEVWLAIARLFGHDFDLFAASGA